jgi:hypothetical protein
MKTTKQGLTLLHIYRALTKQYEQLSVYILCFATAPSRDHIAFASSVFLPLPAAVGRLLTLLHQRVGDAFARDFRRLYFNRRHF